MINNNEMIEFFSTYGRGSLKFVKNELKIMQQIENDNKTDIFKILNDNIEGKLLFSTFSKNLPQLTQLKTIERIFFNQLFIPLTEDHKNIVKTIEKELIFNNNLCYLIMNMITLKENLQWEPENPIKKTTRPIRYRINGSQTF
jgi:hypothetical protein